MQHVDIGHLIEGDHIRLQPFENEAGLTRGACMGLLDLDVLPCLFLPLSREYRIQLGKKFARNVIGKIENAVGCCLRGRKAKQSGQNAEYWRLEDLSYVAHKYTPISLYFNDHTC